MRGKKKFLFRNKWHVFSFFFKNRILNFKRTKWKKIKSKILYAIRQYNFHKKRLVSTRFSRFIVTLKSLKRVVKTSSLCFNLKTLKFLKRLNRFLISKKFKKLKRNLKFRLVFFFKKPYYKKYNFFKKCLNLFFFNYSSIRVASRQHIRKRFFFKNILISKATVIKYFYNYFTLKFFKINKLSNNYIKDLVVTFIKPEMRVDILLWRLKIFKSPYLAKFASKKNLISLNKLTPWLKSSDNFICKRALGCGDIISLNPSLSYNYKKNLKLVVNSFFLPTFIEFDYYTNNIVILKNLDLNFKDINSVLKEPLSFYKFKNSLNK